jgi:parallel beta-helix repeat protein
MAKIRSYTLPDDTAPVMNDVLWVDKAGSTTRSITLSTLRKTLDLNNSVYNVLDYGAVADGMTDDGAAIQAAVDAAYAAGGEVRLPAGTLRFSAPLDLKEGVSLIGDGTAVLQTIGNIAGISVTGSQTVRGFTLRGGNSAPTVFVADKLGLYQSVGPITGLLIEDVEVCDFGSVGILLSGPSLTTVRGCRSHDNGNEGIYFGYLAGCHDNQMLDNYVYKNGSNGLDTNASGTLMRGNTIYGNGIGTTWHPGGVDCTGICIASVGGTTPFNGPLNDVIVESNHIYNNYGYGILVASVDDVITHTHYGALTGVSICNNSIHDNGNGAATEISGIKASVAANCTLDDLRICGNVIRDDILHGIHLTGGTNMVIADNRITGCLDGIHFSSSDQDLSGVTINANIVTACTGRGINIPGSVTIDYTDIIISANKFSDFPSADVSNTGGIYIADGVIGCVITGNLLTGFSGANTPNAIAVRGNSQRVTLTGNCVTDSWGGIYILDTATDVVVANNVVSGNTIPINKSSSGSVIVKSNIGYNPIGPGVFYGMTPAVPASTVAYQNMLGVDCWVLIVAGADVVSAIALGDPAGNFATTGLTLAAGALVSVMVPALCQIKLTYAAAPTWYWYGS